MSPLTNWAGNIRFHARRVHRPESLDELRRIIAGSRRVRMLGTGHSFNTIADTTGDLVSVAGLPGGIELDRARSRARVPAGLRYGELATYLHAHGFALPNLGSLPHIGVAGAVATGTHGSGDRNGGLATAVAALDLVTADGDLLHVDRSDPRFAGHVVSLGALGAVVRLTLDVIPTFEISQFVYDELPRASLDAHLAEIFASGYSVSVFTDWRGPHASQVWLKLPAGTALSSEVPASRPGALSPRPHPSGGPDLETAAPTPPAPTRWLGARLADGQRHPVPGMPPGNCTEQAGVPGPWHQRLPHFRLEFTPSSGAELQSEYLLPRERAVEALAALDPLAGRIAAVLQICELRTIAADDLWLSPSYGRDSLAVHFTWAPDAAAVAGVLVDIERALAPFGARPHWGKVFGVPPAELPGRYPRWDDFAALRADLDPAGVFANDFVDRYFPR